MKDKRKKVCGIGLSAACAVMAVGNLVGCNKPTQANKEEHNNKDTTVKADQNGKTEEEGKLSNMLFAKELEKIL